MVLSQTREPIAIIGIGCRFPGGAHDPTSFWRLLLSGKDAIVPVPATRWDRHKYYDPNPDAPGKIYVREGGFLQQPVDEFDAAFFGISPREAAVLDPQQRLLLEISQEALEDAGIPPSRLRGQAVGVYIGAMTQDYQLLLTRPSNRHLGSPQSASGITLCALSNRISYVYDFKGPSLSIDTACSSSLTALHYACRDLHDGHCRMALCGGVNLMLLPEFMISLCRGRFLSPQARSHAFSEAADGYARGEGAGMVVLKPLARAQADCDPIYALILATAINQDGHTDGFSMPNSTSQQVLLQHVYQQAEVKPAAVAFVETHGTGTKAGDLAEARALATVMSQGRQHKLWLGALKTQIGHLEAAAGVAGLIKTALSLRHRLLPANLHQAAPNSKIDFNSWQLRLPHTHQPLSSNNNNGDPLIAGVNAFGYGGSNAHAVLAAYPATHTPTKTQDTPPITAQSVTRPLAVDDLPINHAPADTRPLVLTLSARQKKGLARSAERWLTALAGDTSDTALCRHAARHLDHQQHRLAIVAHDRTTLNHCLHTYATNQETTSHFLQGEALTDCQPIFVFSGMGKQHPGMGQTLYQTEPIFRQTVDELRLFFQRDFQFDVCAALFADADCSQMTRIDIAQTTHYVLQVALYRLFCAWGIQPRALLGHSAGEVAAAVASGALSPHQGARLSYYRGTLMARLAGRGGMLAVGLSPDAVHEQIADTEIDLSAINGPRAITLSGPVEALKKLARQLRKQRVGSRLLAVDTAYHSRIMDEIAKPLQEALSGLQHQTAQIPWFSTVHEKFLAPEMLGPDYWIDNMRCPVRFAPAAQTLIQDGARVFLELGPYPVLTGNLHEIGKSQEITIQAQPSLRTGMPEPEAMAKALAQLHCHGVAIDWSSYYPGGQRRHGLAATMVWQRDKYFLESDISAADRYQPVLHPFLGHVAPLPGQIWETEISRALCPDIAQHVIHATCIFPAAGFIETALAAALQSQKQTTRALTLATMHFEKMMVLPEIDGIVMQSTLEHHSGHFSIASANRITRCDWKRHMSCRITPSDALLPALPFAEAQQRCRQKYPIETFYTHLQNRGFAYGPAFQSIRHLWLGPDEVLAELQVTETCASHPDYQIAPALLDAAFQALSALLSGTREHATTAMLPHTIAQLHVQTGKPLKKLGTTGWAHLRLKSLNPHRITCNLSLYTRDKIPVLIIREMVFQALVNRENREPFQPTWLYEYAWQPLSPTTPAQQKSSIEPTIPTWHIISPEPTIRDRLMTYPGLTPLTPSPKEDGRHAFSALLWVAPPTGEHPDEASILSLSTLLSRAQADKLSLTVVTRGVHAVIAGDRADSTGQAPLWGWLRVAALEYPQHRLRIVDLPAIPATSDWHALISALTLPVEERELAIRRGRHYGHRLMQFAAQQRQARSLITMQVSPTTPVSLTATATLPAGWCWQQQYTAPSTEKIEKIAISAFALPLGRRPDTDDFLCDAVGQTTDASLVIISDSALLTSSTAIKSLRGAYVELPESVVPQDYLGISALVQALVIGAQIVRMAAGDRVLIDLDLNTDATGTLTEALVKYSLYVGATPFPVSTRTEDHTFYQTLGVQVLTSSAVLQTCLTQDRMTIIVTSSETTLPPEIINNSLGPWGRRVILTASATASSTPADSGISQTITSVAKTATLPTKTLMTLLGQAVNLITHGQIAPLRKQVFNPRQLSTVFDKSLVCCPVIQFDHDPLRVQPASANRLFSDTGIYLVTGGFSGFGAHLAKWLVKQGVNRIALLSRQGQNTPEAQSLLSELKQMGATPMAMATDVGDKKALGTALMAIRKKGALVGIFHAASACEDGLLSTLNAATVTHGFHAKLRGAQWLHELTRQAPLRYFVLFSSLSGMIGNPGQGVYAAANAYLDSLAQHRHALGKPALSINWGAIARVGMVAREKNVQQHLYRYGVGLLPPDTALAALGEAIKMQDTPQLAIADINWQRWPGAANYRQFSYLHVATTHPAQETLRWTGTLTQQRKTAHTMTTTIISHAFNLPSTQVNPQQPITQYGLDSLLALEIAVAIEKKMGVKIDTLQILAGPSIDTLSDMIVQNIMSHMARTGEAGVSVQALVR